MKIRSMFGLGLMSLALTSAFSAHAVDTVLSNFNYSPFGALPEVQADNTVNFITTVTVAPPLLAPNGQPSYLGAGRFTATHGLDSFQAYCVEINIPVGIPGSYSDYALADAATAFGDRATDLAKLATWATVNNLPSNAATSAAMQAAVWEIVHESTPGPYSFSAGKLATSSNSVATQNALNAIDWMAIAAITPTITINGLESAGRQDLLVFAPVPETGTLTMMMLGLAGFGVFAQRKLDKKV